MRYQHPADEQGAGRIAGDHDGAPGQPVGQPG